MRMGKPVQVEKPITEYRTAYTNVHRRRDEKKSTQAAVLHAKKNPFSVVIAFLSVLLLKRMPSNHIYDDDNGGGAINMICS